jgi:hypothetical protein
MLQVFKGVSTTIGAACVLLTFLFSVYIFYHEVRDHNVDLKVLKFLSSIGMKTDRSRSWFIVLLLSIVAFLCFMMA